jgi:hypothetical protein
MILLGTAIAENVVHHYGVSALMSRLADPYGELRTSTLLICGFAFSFLS